jgi:UDP-N-acetylglucosamine:LPS N-acetylglucosamine transferase
MASFGSSGNEEVYTISQLLKDKQCILMCANNAELKARLEQLGNPKHRVEGFVNSEAMAKRMRASDIIIGKAGFCLVSEAIQCEAAYISLEGLITLQEETSERYFIKNNLGKKSKLEDLPQTVDEVLADPSYREALSKMQNNAAEQVADIARDVVDNYEDWQDKLWGKKSWFCSKQGHLGGHHEIMRAIKQQL